MKGEDAKVDTLEVQAASPVNKKRKGGFLDETSMQVGSSRYVETLPAENVIPRRRGRRAGRGRIA